MTTPVSYPGTYFIEVTSPGVITGVPTSNLGIIGPALRGPLYEPRRVTSFDEFNELFGSGPGGRTPPYLFGPSEPYYLGFALEGFFNNGGSTAYVVRIGTAVRASLVVNNQAPEAVFTITSRIEGAEGNQIQAAVEAGTQDAVATVANVTAVNGAVLTLNTAAAFRVGDLVSTVAAPLVVTRIDRIVGNDVTLNVALGAAAQLRIADLVPPNRTLRLVSTFGLNAGGTAIINGFDTLAAPATERVDLLAVNPTGGVVTFVASTVTSYTLDPAVGTPPALQPIHVFAAGQSIINIIAGNVLTVASAAPFRPGDIVTDGVNRARIDRIQNGNEVVVATPLAAAAVGNPLIVADVQAGQRRFRVHSTAGLTPGTPAQLHDPAGPNPPEWVVVEAVDGAGFITLAAPTAFAYVVQGVALGAEPFLEPSTFRLVITGPPPAAGPPATERIEGLSLNPAHPRFVLNPGRVDSQFVTIEPPLVPPVAAALPAQLVTLAAAANLGGGVADNPAALTAAEYQQGLDALARVDDVSQVCIPDAASHFDRQTIQTALLVHCQMLRDRIAILDSVPAAPPNGPGSVEEQRQLVEDDHGFAALYYPWLRIRDPRSTGTQRRMVNIPPSGHIAGVYARTDAERGVHKAPANTDVRGVLGLERVNGVDRRLTDRQQGPLNLAGINVLRVFPGAGRVMVWGARTTVPVHITDWLYVPVRRLTSYVAESVEEGIRWAVFEPNDTVLWAKLRRTVSEFLTRVWKDGALFGDSAAQAFYVRVDEALNPPAVRAIGRLYMEIGLAAVRPAEFLIVRLGLWDGGSEIGA